MPKNIAPSSTSGADLPAVALDYTRAKNLSLTSSTSAGQTFDASIVFVFAFGGNARISVGENPTAGSGDGSIPIAAGTYFPVVKDRTEKISVISGDATPSGYVDMIPVREKA